MNPIVRLSSTISGHEIQSLLTAIRLSTGCWYGYHAEELIDTQMISFSLVFNRNPTHKKFLKADKQTVTVSIQSWAIGAGYGLPMIRWDNVNGITFEDMGIKGNP